ncbi:MAG: hypothetical protein ACRD7E_23770, partial [Bryobacteraceae bacterium]
MVKLTAHFTHALFRTGDEDSERGFDPGMGSLLALLAIPGVFVSLFLFEKYSSLIRFFRRRLSFDPYLASVPDEYFFIVFAMAITGLVTVMKWNSILPGKRDFLILSPLPVGAWQIFSANLAAILLAAAVFTVDVNIGSMILFPMIVTSEIGKIEDLARFAGIHALSVTLASAFAFFACLSVMGALMAVLPRRAFEKVSMPVRVLLIICLIAIFFSSFAPPEILRNAMSHPDALGRWLPSMWYLALYQT